jgi:hypothetical protein
MATASAAPLPIPPPNQPVVDPRTGLMNRDWYDFFQRLSQSFAVVRSEIP